MIFNFYKKKFIDDSKRDKIEYFVVGKKNELEENIKKTYENMKLDDN